MNEYKNFSKQDLKDRQRALEMEEKDLDKLRWNIIGEIIRIDKLLEK